MRVDEPANEIVGGITNHESNLLVVKVTAGNTNDRRSVFNLVSHLLFYSTQTFYMQFFRKIPKTQKPLPTLVVRVGIEPTTY